MLTDGDDVTDGPVNHLEAGPVNMSLSAVVLFEASMEFLDNTNSDDDDDDDDDEASFFISAPLLPRFPPVANETLPMRYDHAHREEQAGAVAMGGAGLIAGKFEFALEEYFTLRLRGNLITLWMYGNAGRTLIGCSESVGGASTSPDGSEFTL